MTADTASIAIAAPARAVFDVLADPANMSLWSFGTWRTEIDASGLVRGTALRDGRPICVRIAPHPDVLLIDYHIGADPDALTPRIFVRLHETGPATCLLMMTAIRGADMDDARWALLQATHRVELDLIRSAIETGYDHRTA